MTVEKQLVDTVDRAFLLSPFFIGQDKATFGRRQKTTLHMHQTDREGNEMFMLRRVGAGKR